VLTMEDGYITRLFNLQQKTHFECHISNNSAITE